MVRKWLKSLFVTSSQERYVDNRQEIEAEIKQLEDTLNDLKTQYKEKLKAAKENLTQPENPYRIVKIAWDKEEKSGGFRVYRTVYYTNDLFSDLFRFAWYGPSDQMAKLQYEIREYEQALQSSLTGAATRAMSSTLFPTFEIAEKWLLSFINGPDVVVYSPQGIRGDSIDSQPEEVKIKSL